MEASLITQLQWRRDFAHLCEDRIERIVRATREPKFSSSLLPDLIPPLLPTVHVEILALVYRPETKGVNIGVVCVWWCGISGSTVRCEQYESFKLTSIPCFKN